SSDVCSADLAAAGAGGQRRVRVLLAEPAAAALRTGGRGRGRAGRDPLAVGPRPDDRGARARSRAHHQGAGMTTQAATTTAATPAKAFRIDKRYLAPILVTIVLIGGQVTFGFLESWSRTALAIGTSIGIEMLLGLIFTGRVPHLASAYVSGISVGMLVRSPELWPYALCSALAITS